MEDLEDWREKIDALDFKILKTISERFFIVEQIGKIKAENGKQIEDNGRENQVVETRQQAFSELFEKDDEFVEKLFKLLMDKSKKIQEEI